MMVRNDDNLVRGTFRNTLLDEAFAILDAIVGEDASQELNDKLAKYKEDLAKIDELDAFTAAHALVSSELETLMKFETANKAYDALLAYGLGMDKKTTLYYEYQMMCEEYGGNIDHLTESGIEAFLTELSRYRFYLENGPEAQVLEFCKYI